jgi:hypothetical protein
MSSVLNETEAISVAPWAIEADHPRNCDLLLQCISGARLRSAIDGSKPTIDVKTNEPMVPLDQAKGLASFPKVPGMQVHVNPEALTYQIIDPLHDNKEMLARVERFLQQTRSIKPSGRLNGVPPREGKLDAHQMKTLNREMLNLVNAGEAKVLKGSIRPDEEDIARLPGYYLLNPGSVVPNGQPRYEKDMEQWVSNLSHSGM